jgi:hypothetical protein
MKHQADHVELGRTPLRVCGGDEGSNGGMIGA